MQPTTRPTIRIVLQILGFVALGLGFAGAFLPLLPTTPFILLSAWCFAKSSPRWHSYLHHHREFGPLLTNWSNNRSVSKKHKIVAACMVVLSITGILISDKAWELKAGLSLGLSFILVALFCVKTANR